MNNNSNSFDALIFDLGGTLDGGKGRRGRK